MDNPSDLIKHMYNVDFAKFKCSFANNTTTREILNQLKVPYTSDVENVHLDVTDSAFVDLLKFSAGRKVLESTLGHMIDISVMKTRDDAVIPTKCRFSDVGYDLTVIDIHKRLNKNTIMYDTGIQISLPPTYYAEIVARSSLVKTGWVLTNSIGIIDNAYTGNLYVVVSRIESDAEELELPFRGFQLLLRKQVYGDVVLVEKISASSSRGECGFGSSDKKEN
jgi:deoxyuridine 5'-triphosphate nucleotidohydrolase